MSGASSRVSTRLVIPHETEPNVNLVGILQQVESGESTIDRNIALVRFRIYDRRNPLLSVIDSAWNVRVSLTTSCFVFTGVRDLDTEFLVLRHKDYLFQKKLAESLPLDSFRFDFRYAFIFSNKERKLARTLLLIGVFYVGSSNSAHIFFSHHRLNIILGAIMNPAAYGKSATWKMTSRISKLSHIT